MTTEQSATPANTEVLRVALTEVTDRGIAVNEESVRIAVRYIAALVRERYPQALRVELEGSDQGDWLIPLSIDGNEAKVEALEDGLYWAASCIYDAHRTASTALHSTNDRPVHRTDLLYINIAEALDGN